MEITETLKFLIGAWALERSIADHRSGIRGIFEGSATLVEVPNGRSCNPSGRARYDETGELHFGAHTGPASRSLEYTSLNRKAVLLYFTDGRPFTDLDLRSGTWRSIHHCGQDRYEVMTFVCSHSEVEEVWRVQGPPRTTKPPLPSSASAEISPRQSGTPWFRHYVAISIKICLSWSPDRSEFE